MKAKMAGKDETRQSSLAGMFSVINENTEIIAWVWHSSVLHEISAKHISSAIMLIGI